MLANMSQEFSQHSPFQDQPKQKGAVPQADDNPTGAGSGTPLVPTDPTMSGWLQPSNGRQLGGAHNFQPAPSALQGAIMGAKGAAEGGIQPMPSGSTGGIPGIAPPATGAGGYSAGNPPPYFDPSMIAKLAQGGAGAGQGAAAGGVGGLVGAGTAAMGHAFNPPGNSQQQWQDFIGKNGATGTYARTHMPELISQYNQMYGTNAKAGRPNAKGLTDVADFGNGDVDLIHGGDDKWQFLENPDGSPGGSGVALANMDPNAALAQTGSSNPLMQAIMQRLQKRQV